MTNEIVAIKNNQAVISSLQIADNFGKQHKDVLHDIDILLIRNPHLRDFVKETTYIHNQNKQRYRMYELNDDIYKIILNKYNHFRTYVGSKFSDKLYIVKHKHIDEYFKIGITNNLESRIKSLNTASPTGIELVFCLQSKNARKIENYIHNKYKERNSNGEWFNLGKEELNYIIKELKNQAI